MGIRKFSAVVLAVVCLASVSVPLSAVQPPAVSTALVPVPDSAVPVFKDDGDLKTLGNAVQHSLQYYSGLPSTASVMFGADAASPKELESGLLAFLSFLRTHPSLDAVNAFIKTHFEVYRSAGSDGLGRVTFSAYYEHRMKAALSPSEKFRYPIYSRPKDLVSENGSFGRLDGTRLLPYYSREEIDSKGMLKGRGLEIAWADNPIDILLLQIQGSGWLEVLGSTETLHIRYAADNGLPYRSVGQYLIESGKLPRLNFSRAVMTDYLNRLSKEARQEMLNQNPRYIFFEIVSSTNPTRGSLMVPLTAGRSVASDPKIYPPGALSWIKMNGIERFVLNQDEGGAIKGPSRIDYFAGGGKEAEKLAQSVWSGGELYFFRSKRE